jgi:hypothetical protein
MTPPFGGVCKWGVPARCAGEVRYSSSSLH